MRKKLIFTIGLLISLIFTFAVTFCFATDESSIMNGVNDAVNGVRNTVGDAENTVEGAVKDVTNTTKNKTSDMQNNMDNNTTNLNITDNNTPSTGYTANRTSTARSTTSPDTGNFLGMSSTMWTWLILAIAVVAIIALVWYYSNQLTNKRYDDE